MHPSYRGETFYGGFRRHPLVCRPCDREVPGEEEDDVVDRPALNGLQDDRRLPPIQVRQTMDGKDKVETGVEVANDATVVLVCCNAQIRRRRDLLCEFPYTDAS